VIVHAATGNLKKVSLELGGKSPNIVLEDADIDAAIPGAASAIFFNQGQCCCAGSRLFVDKKIFDKVVDGVRKPQARSVFARDLTPTAIWARSFPKSNSTRSAAIWNPARKKAQSGDGRWARGNRGYFVQPTVLVDTTENMKVVREEIFGPVVTATPFTDINEIAAKATIRSTVSLQGSGRAISRRRMRSRPKLRAGTVWINCYNVFDAALPFRWIQAVRLGPRDGPRSPQELQRGQVRLLRRCKSRSRNKKGPSSSLGPFLFSRCNIVLLRFGFCSRSCCFHPRMRALFPASSASGIIPKRW